MRLRLTPLLVLALASAGVGCSDPINTSNLTRDGGAEAGPTVDLGAGVDVVPGDDAGAGNDVVGSDDVVAIDAPGMDAPAVDAPTADAPAVDVPTPTDVRVACANNRDCTSSGQLCDTASGACVQCLTGAQCTGAGQVCQDHRCVAGTACMSSRTCTGQVCETMRGVCVDCLTDVDCTGGSVCRANNCVAPPLACRSSRECSARDQVCDAARGVCVDCLGDVDCGAGQFCGTDNLCRAQVCMPGATSCVDVGHVRTCDARGASTADRACGATEVCATGMCRARVCMPGERSCGSSTQSRVCNPDGLGYTTTACAGALTCSAGTCTDCVDTDGDGISDALEGAPSRDTDGDRTPDYMDMDSDNDGFTDLVEGARRYPGFTGGAIALSCGGAPDNCDAALEGRPNYVDLDSDNDGVADADERAASTNPCARDTDGDGFTDLVEQVAHTDPTMAASRPPASALAVELPFRGGGGPVVNQELTFTKRARPADVMFVVDSTGSMQPTITQLQTASAAIVDGVTSALGGASADVRFGVADYRDFGEGDSSTAYLFTVRQRLDRDGARTQSALSTFSAAGGGDGPEGTVPALYGLLNGLGLANYRGTASRAASAGDCGGDAASFGWACFLPGRTPIFIVYSDAGWHNGPGSTTNFYAGTSGTPTYPQLTGEMVRRSARFIAVDVATSTRDHSTASAAFARDTANIPASGSPFVFTGSASATQAQVVSAVASIVGQARTSISTAVVADPTETRLAAGRRTSEFVRVINALSGSPEAPTGYDRRDGGTFVGVASGTTVTFNAVLANDLVAAGAVDQVFAVYVNLYDDNFYVEQRTVYVVVPAPR